jgi:hypothetical protein
MQTHADQRTDCQMHVFDRQRIRRVGPGGTSLAGRCASIRHIAALRLEVVEQELAFLDADQDRAGIEQQGAVAVHDRPVERRADRNGVKVQCGRHCPDG